MASEEKSVGTVKKRKTMWDADASNKEIKTDAAVSMAPSVQSQSVAAGLLPTPVGTDVSAQIAAQAQLQQALQQQQMLQQVRAMTQQRVAELASKQAAVPAGVGVANRIYVGNLFYELTETELILAFSMFGTILKIDMPKDPATARHKGFCFIEYASAEAAATALATMNDFILAGRPIKVGRPNNFSASPAPAATPNPALATFLQQQALAQATGSPSALAAVPGAPSTNLVEAKLQAQAVAAAISLQKQQQLGIQSLTADLPTPTASSINSRIYVGSIFYDIKEEDIKAIFGAFGTIKSCQLLPNPETGKHKGYGFVEYETEASAQAAISSMNGFELANRQLKVGWASATNSPGISAPGAQPGIFSTAAAGLHLHMTDETPIALEENLAIGVDQRLAIMQKLAARDTTSPTAKSFFSAAQATTATAVKPAPVVPAPAPVSRCIVLLNMVGPEEVDEELQQEVTEECGKYGVVEKVVIYKKDADEARAVDAPVRIFVVFSSIPEAQSGLKALHGRWFGGREVTARYFDEQKLNNEDYSV